jgi:NAD-dependent dihydropyrimidine dehydrogenase PreA subunit
LPSDAVSNNEVALPDVKSAAGCDDVAGKVAPFVDRNRCEGKADCVRVCPYGVFEIRKLAPEDRFSLSIIGRLKAWVHGWKQSHVVNPGDCHACRLCIDACPENALELRPIP